VIIYVCAYPRGEIMSDKNNKLIALVF